MKFMLDTNICIYVINERPERVLARFEEEIPGTIGVSSVTVSELAFGVAKTGSGRNRKALEQFLIALQVADFDLDCAWVYGSLRAQLEKKGTLIGPLDLQIAAHALTLQTTLVTNNMREFRRVPGLLVENWASSH